MNPSIKQLMDISAKPSRKIIGLMSGTSLDGLDIALCEIKGSGGDTTVELLEFETFDYDAETKKRLKKISSVPKVSLDEVCLMHTWLGDYHGKLIRQALETWQLSAADIDCVASHGQTIYHAPAIQHRQEGMPNSTLQIGDGDHIARISGILTISDFRQKHTAAGGEGAPMVSLVDRVLFGHPSEDRILLNIGGIANFTWLPAGDSSDKDSVTTDTGPGNTLIDQATQKYFSNDFDKDSRIARRGTVDQNLLSVLKDHEYFQKTMPKTTGPEVFNLGWIDKTLDEHNIAEPEPADLIATLTRFSAETIADAIAQIQYENNSAIVYVSGGGIHNPLLTEWLQELLPDHPIRNFEEIGFNPDAKEAVLFAVLANETLSGNGFAMDTEQDTKQKVNFGKISFPK